ncbi:MAG: outer membrane beta-barrel protein [Bryobacteraceae bacterium]
MFKSLICVAILAAATASAQEWDVGITGGFAMANDLTVKNGANSANAGFKNGAVFGVYAGQDMYRYWSGEANYLYRRSDLKMEGNGKSSTLDGHTHLITGDILAHFRPRGARIRPFVSFGGGIKLMVGTGNEGIQPLGNTLAALTATNETMPVGEVGAGVKIQLSKMVRLRLQVRDFISGKPNDVISTVPGATMSGFSNDILGTVSLGLTW